jgi:hypothetical protein
MFTHKAVRNIKKLLTIAGLCSCLLSAPSLANLPTHNAVPGGVAVVPLSDISEQWPNVMFGQKKVLVCTVDGTWFAIVGLPQDILPGKYLVTINWNEESQYRRSFRVHPLPAIKEQRTIVLPDHLQNIAVKPITIEELMAGSDEPYSDQPGMEIDFNFQQLVTSGSYIPYGRILRNKISSELIDHPWVTYVTKPEEIIRSPGRGIVQQIYFSESSGISVVIDHGSGLKSVLNHIRETILKPGEIIETGDPVGITTPLEGTDFGRTDWFLILNEALIDPLQFTTSS